MVASVRDRAVRFNTRGHQWKDLTGKKRETAKKMGAVSKSWDVEGIRESVVSRSQIETLNAATGHLNWTMASWSILGGRLNFL